MKYTILLAETEEKLAVVDRLDQGDAVAWDVSGKNFNGSDVRVEDGVLKATLAGGERLVFPVYAQSPDGSFLVATALGNIKILAQRGVALEAAGGGRAAHKSIKSTMPGKVVKILCKAGDSIQPGQPILILEAMKMENEIAAPQGGVVEEIPVAVGQSVQPGDLLVKLGTK